MIDGIANILTLDEVAEKLKLSPQAVRNLAISGDLRGFKTANAPNGHWRFEESEVRAYLDRMTNARHAAA